MIIVILVVLGLAFGSFVNALVWRMYQQSLPKKKRAASDAELSISSGRSMCPHCKHTLAWYDLLPVLSWLFVAGKCRYCKKPISPQYPVVELVTAVLFVTSYVFWLQDLSTIIIQQSIFILWLAAIVGFVALTVYDLRWMLLPNRVVYPLIGIGVAVSLLRLWNADSIAASAVSSILGLMVAGGIFYVVFQISNGTWIGGGDVKLGFALGLLLGSPLLAFLMLFLASCIGLIAALPGMIRHKSTSGSKIPFGPCLIGATIIAMLFGQSMIDWYTASVLYL